MCTFLLIHVTGQLSGKLCDEELNVSLSKSCTWFEDFRTVMNPAASEWVQLPPASHKEGVGRWPLHLKTGWIYYSFFKKCDFVISWP